MAQDGATLEKDPTPKLAANAPLLGSGARLLGFAMAAIGVMGVVRGDFTAVYHPMPEFIPGRVVVASLCNAGLAANGAALLLGRTGRIGAWLLAALWLFLSLGWTIRVALFPLMIGTWLGLAEQLALVTGAVAVAAGARAAPHWLATGTRVAFGLCQLVFALAHFLAIQETVAMTPAYLPGGARFWALATGGLHLAGGACLLLAVRPVTITRGLAAMYASFGLLVWLPTLFSGLAPASLAGNLINLALIGAVLAVGDAIASRVIRQPPFISLAKDLRDMRQPAA